MVSLAPGSVLSGRYRLQSHLGQGATSAVWKARDLDLGRAVAVKVLLGHGVDPELASRFEREGTILGRLSHPNVVPVYATGNDDGQRYLVMELVDGVSLDQRLATGPLPVDEAVEVAVAVAAALGAAHKAGVVHRDVKPANIVCGHDGVPRLVDFGIARADDLTSMTRADTVLGTANYLSPEQAKGDVPGPASDVYALGCVLFQAITGSPPFTGDSPLSVAYKHVHDEAPPLDSGRPDIDAVVARALAKSPADRYRTGAELEAALQGRAPVEEPTVAVAAVTGVERTMLMPAVEPAAAGMIDPSPLAPPAEKDRRWSIAAAAAAAVVVLALALGSLGGDGGKGATPAQADTTTTTSTTLAPTTTTAPPTTLLPPVEVKVGKRPKGPKHKR